MSLLLTVSNKFSESRMRGEIIEVLLQHTVVRCETRADQPHQRKTCNHGCGAGELYSRMRCALLAAPDSEPILRS